MSNHPTPESIPISSLNALEYCPRRFYYQFVQGEMLINNFVLEGTLIHQRAHQPGKQTTAEGETQTRRLYLCSETLHLSGFADVIEEQGGMPIPVEYKHGHKGKWLNDHIQLCAQALCLEERLVDLPEKGRPPASTRLANAAAAAHCKASQQRCFAPTATRSAEMQGVRATRSGKTKGEGSPLHGERAADKVHIPYGYIYYVSSRRRVRVDFTEELRARTRAAIARALQVAMLEKPPAPLTGKLTVRCPNCSLLPLCLPDEVKLLRSKKENAHANPLPD